MSDLYRSGPTAFGIVLFHVKFNVFIAALCFLGVNGTYLYNLVFMDWVLGLCNIMLTCFESEKKH